MTVAASHCDHQKSSSAFHSAPWSGPLPTPVAVMPGLRVWTEELGERVGEQLPPSQGFLGEDPQSWVDSDLGWS